MCYHCGTLRVFSSVLCVLFSVPSARMDRASVRA
uniref:Uncharacterized protein n=1 Tax=Anguilla anguilla TaxID=7936 RepID=A0A0E9UUI8_ANGAN